MVIMTCLYKYECIYYNWFLLAGFKKIQSSKLKSDANDNDNDNNNNIVIILW